VGWRLGDGRFMCPGCGFRTSVTAGTIFDRTRTPLTVWFTVCWLFATAKDGVSALSLQRTLEIGSYQTTWAMLHRLRSVLVNPGRDRLSGVVGVDETYIGGEGSGLSGGRAKGKKVLVGATVEVKEPKGFGRCRMAILTDASAASLLPFGSAHVEPGTTVITDAWQGYNGINALGYVHDRLASGRHGPEEKIPARSCLGCTGGSRPLSSGGCSVPTKGRQTKPTWPPTWTSSCSVLTASSPVAEGCSSTGYSSSSSDITPCGTATSSPVRNHGRCYLYRHRQEDTHRAWIDRHWTDLGELLTYTTPVKWRARTGVLSLSTLL
jgi:hypothetical protein